MKMVESGGIERRSNKAEIGRMGCRGVVQSIEFLSRHLPSGTRAKGLLIANNNLWREFAASILSKGGGKYIVMSGLFVVGMLGGGAGLEVYITC